MSFESRIAQSFSEAAIRATGVSLDPKLMNFVGEREAAVLGDARMKQEALVAASDPAEPAPSNGPQFLMRAQATAGASGPSGPSSKRLALWATD